MGQPNHTRRATERMSTAIACLLLAVPVTSGQPCGACSGTEQHCLTRLKLGGVVTTVAHG